MSISGFRSALRNLRYWIAAATRPARKTPRLKRTSKLAGIHDLFWCLLLALFIFLCPQESVAWGKFDSLKKSTLIINPRLHTSGYFPFTGALLNRNPVFDVNIFFEKGAFGFFVFQSFDLADRHSYVNYLQPGVFGTLRFTPNLRIRAFFGYVFSQTQGFRDPDSDYYASLQLNWVLWKEFRIENTLLYYDYTVNSDKLANRLLMEWAPGKVRISGYVWQRTVLEEGAGATSGALAITFPIVKVSKRTSLELTTTYMGYLTDHKPDFALQDGLFFTLAVPVDASPAH